MGEVYLGQVDGAANFSKQVAIKRILPHLSNQPDFVRKFIDEANVMVQMHHGNIVSVVELADEEGQLYLVMDYVPGRDLKAIIRRLKTGDVQLPVDLALWIIRQILDGLDYAHRKVDENGLPMNIVHRDVSPANIILGAGGEVKLIDFGIARARGRIQQSVSGTLQGKFVYMSPEQAAGLSVGPSTDIFSAGMVLYELLCLVRPFDGESETETLRLVRECKISPPSVVNQGGSDQLDALVMKALTLDPADRYQSCADMAQEIRRHLVAIQSEVGAAELGAFLEELFPDGVVPKEEASPKNLDDLLMQQLDAFTPSPSNRSEFTQTRTGKDPLYTYPLNVNSHTGPLTPISAVRTEPPLVGDLYPTGATPVNYQTNTGSTAIDTKAVGRKRMLFLGLMLGALGALGVLLIGDTQPSKIRVETTPLSAENVVLTVDGVQLRQGEEFTSGRVYSVCAAAKGFLKQCNRHRFKPGEHTLQLELIAQPKLQPSVEPSNIPHRILIDRVHTTQWPFYIKPDREYVVCVEANGHVVTPNCRRITGKRVDLSPRFTLKAIPKKPATLANQPAKKVAQNGTTKEAQRTAVSRPPRKRSRGAATHSRRPPPVVTIRSIPTATVKRNGKEVGTTPYKISLTKETQRFTLSAKGYAETPFAIKPNGKTRTETIALQRPGYLTIRIRPAASQIFIDKKLVGTGVLIRHPLKAGSHQLEVEYKKDGKIAAKYGPRTIVIVAGENANLGPVTLKLPSP